MSAALLGRARRWPRPAHVLRVEPSTERGRERLTGVLPRVVGERSLGLLLLAVSLEDLHGAGPNGDDAVASFCLELLEDRLVVLNRELLRNADGAVVEVDIVPAKAEQFASA